MHMHLQPAQLPSLYIYIYLPCAALSKQYGWSFANRSLTGAWTIHLVLIAALKILFDIIPGVSQETSWTLTNISYMFGSFLMFHWVRGVPFEFNAGAYDNLNMWEQIDDGAQYTPAKKFLLSVPIVLFLLSTHYTHYDLTYFTINFLAVLGVVIPKLPYVSLPLVIVGLGNRRLTECLEPSHSGRPVRRPGGELVPGVPFRVAFVRYLSLGFILNDYGHARAAAMHGRCI